MPITVGSTQPAPNVGPGVPGTALQPRSADLAGVVFGAVDQYGTEVRLNDIQGWLGGTGTSGTITQRSGSDGGWLDIAYRPPRSLEVVLTLVADSFEQLDSSIAAIMAAVPLNVPQEMRVVTTARVLSVFVRQDSGDVLQSQQGHIAQLSIPLIAPDPRRYSVDTATASTGLPQTSGGLSLPLVLPLSVGAVAASGALTVTNAGNTDTNPTLTVAGPCPPFTIANRTTGAILRFADAISAGRSLVIDTDRGLAMLDGTAPRTVSGTPLRAFTYAPGDNEIAFSAASYDAGALLTSTHRHAYL